MRERKCFISITSQIDIQVLMKTSEGLTIVSVNHRWIEWAKTRERFHCRNANIEYSKWKWVHVNLFWRQLDKTFLFSLSLQKFEKKYHREEAEKKTVSPQTKFEYAWSLVRSDYPADIKKVRNGCRVFFSSYIQLLITFDINRLSLPRLGNKITRRSGENSCRRKPRLHLLFGGGQLKNQGIFDGT